MSQEEWLDGNPCSAYSTAGPRPRASGKREWPWRRIILQKTYKQPDQSQTIDRRAVAGAVVFYMEDIPSRNIYYCITPPPLGLPKGNIEAGENEKQTATREIREETLHY